MYGEYPTKGIGWASQINPAPYSQRMAEPILTIRPGNPDFLDLPWETSLKEWDLDHRVDLPKGISRHEVQFYQYPEGLFVVKELPTAPARNDYEILRRLQSRTVSAVTPVGLVVNRHQDRGAEQSAALITAWAEFTFSYRELIAGAGFAGNRTRMLDAFAELLVELHLAGCYWGDCSLSNVLYRWDAGTIETIMVDAETSTLRDDGNMSDGRRLEDIEIMKVNVAGGMADIAAESKKPIDEADLFLGEEIADVYYRLWDELKGDEVIPANEQYRVQERIRRVNRLGFDVDEVDVIPVDGGSNLRLHLRVGGKTFHSNRLRELTGIDALENQARQILSDLYHFQATEDIRTPTLKNVSSIKWRMSQFEPVMERIRETEGISDPLQAYCDVLHHRYVVSAEQGRDVETEEAFEDWLAKGRPGYPEEWTPPEV